MLNLLGELIVARSALSQTVGEFSQQFPKDRLRAKFADALAHQSRVLNELQRAVMKIRMVPVEQLFRRFPRIVRDVAKLLGKEVALEVGGQNTDLDKTILDALSEPMIQLVRNAVNHGLEPPQERLAAGKSAQGCLRLNACHQGNQVVIEVADDGRGIDRQRIADVALERGLISPQELERMSSSDVLGLIFEPGFSTAEEVTQLSGRGVGLDVVKAVLERMKGTISVHTEAGKGTTFQLKVPLTLAITKALLFRVGERLFAVPLSAVLEVARAREGEIHRMDGREILQLRGQVLTMVRLDNFRAGPQESRAAGASLAGMAASKGTRVFAVVVAVAGRKFGLIVDGLVGEEQLVIKNLDNELVSTELVSGVSILGDGTVVMILNIAAVIERLGQLPAAKAIGGRA